MARMFQELLASGKVVRVFSVSRIIHPVVFDLFGMAGGAGKLLPWCKYAPRGDRGMTPSGFDSRYTYKPLGELVVDANRDGFVAIQIATLGALDEGGRI